MANIYEFLNQHGIAYERFDHQAVFTVEESRRLLPTMPGADTKNLFLRDKKGKRHLLVIVPHAKAVDLKELAKVIGVNRLSFGSPERLAKYLGINPGSVSLLALLNDSVKKVEVYLDGVLDRAHALRCHPLINTSTLVISRPGIDLFLKGTGHSLNIVAIPEKQSV